MRLPDFLIIGAQKAGTSAARHNLGQHPDIAFNTRGPAHGELHFFDRDAHWQRGADWYASHFDAGTTLVGEKTPNYLSSGCAARIAQVVPGARLLVLLREPVSRACSHWNHFNQNPAAAGEVWRVMAFENAIERYPSLLTNGHYADQLRTLWQHFPRHQVHVTIQERLLADMPAGYAAMLRFLGLQPVPDMHPQRVHGRPLRLAPPAAVRDRLRTYYAEQVQTLRELLDDPLPEWD